MKLVVLVTNVTQLVLENHVVHITTAQPVNLVVLIINVPRLVLENHVTH